MDKLRATVSQKLSDPSTRFRMSVIINSTLNQFILQRKKHTGSGASLKAVHLFCDMFFQQPTNCNISEDLIQVDVRFNWFLDAQVAVSAGTKNQERTMTSILNKEKTMLERTLTTSASLAGLQTAM